MRGAALPTGCRGEGEGEAPAGCVEVEGGAGVPRTGREGVPRVARGEGGALPCMPAVEKEREREGEGSTARGEREGRVLD